MFARTVDVNAKKGKTSELIRTINDQVLALLKKQPGFVDLISLIARDNPDRVLSVSFWKTREDAERYNREAFSRVNDLIVSVIEGPPQVHTFDVATSTAHNIVGKAA